MDGTTGPSPANQAAAGSLFAAAKTLRELAFGLESGAKALLGGETPPAEHECRMPAGWPPPFTIHRCGCGRSYRLYPAADTAPAEWREI